MGEVAEAGARGTPPIHAVVIVEATVLDRDERRAHLPRHPRERHVDAADIGQPPDGRARAIEDPSALAGPEGLDLGGGRTSGEAAGGDPTTGGERQDEQQGERRECETRPGERGKLQLACGAPPAVLGAASLAVGAPLEALPRW